MERKAAHAFTTPADHEAGVRDAPAAAGGVASGGESRSTARVTVLRRRGSSLRADRWRPEPAVEERPRRRGGSAWCSSRARRLTGRCASRASWDTWMRVDFAQWTTATRPRWPRWRTDTFYDKPGEGMNDRVALGGPRAGRQPRTSALRLVAAPRYTEPEARDPGRRTGRSRLRCRVGRNFGVVPSPGAQSEPTCPRRRDGSWFERPRSRRSSRRGAGAVTEDRARLQTPSRWHRRRSGEAPQTAPQGRGRLHAEQHRTAIAAAKAKAEESASSAARRSTCRRRGEPVAQRLHTGSVSSDAASGHVGDTGGRVPVRRRGRSPAPTACSSAKTSTRAGVSSTTRGCSTRGIITAPNVVLAGIVGSGKSSLAKSLYARSHRSGGACTFNDPRANTPPSPTPSADAPSSGHGLNTRLNPLDEGHRPGGLSDDSGPRPSLRDARDLISARGDRARAGQCRRWSTLRSTSP